MINRRDFIKQISAAGIAGCFPAAAQTASWAWREGEMNGGTSEREIIGDPKIRGPFPILSTPFTTSGAVDYDVLAREAQFVDQCKCPGMIWPQSGDSLDLLTMDEKLRGMEVLSNVKRKHSALCLGVQGKDTEEMLIFARHAEKLAPDAIISRPPDTGKTEEDLRAYWRALAKVVNRPVIIQTTGGVSYKGPVPSVDLLVELARESPYFGYVKEEANPVMPRMRELMAAKPVIRRVFSAWGGFGWLHQSHIGTEGLITERVAYADLLTDIWNLMENGREPEMLAEAFGRMLFMLNLHETIPGGTLRGAHLYVLKKRGIFSNLISRQYGAENSIPKEPIYSEQQFSEDEIKEIEWRMDLLRLSRMEYLKKG